MEDLFDPRFWSSRPPSHTTAAQPIMAKPSRPAKVVSVPVHFVSSDETKQRRSAANRETERITPSAAALAIQRVFRGFLVRKHLSSLRWIEAEVDTIEKEAERAGDRLRRDARERLRVSETLMALLLRLDSVRGVREYRRRVIRKAIALQEAVDAIAAVEESKEGTGAAGDDVGDGNAPLETSEAQEATPAEIPRSMDSDPQFLEIHIRAPDCRDEDRQEEKKADDEYSVDHIVAEEFKQEEGGSTAEMTTEEVYDLPAKEAPCIDASLEKGSGAMDKAQTSEDLDAEPVGGSAEAPMSEDERNEQAKASAQPQDIAEGGAGQGCGEASVRPAMERAAEESRGLKGLVAELCGRNERQLRLMDGLLQRVERLEKVVKEMGRKRQKTQHARKGCARRM